MEIRVAAAQLPVTGDITANAALIGEGLDFAVSDRLSAGVSYSGQYADSVSDNGVKGRLTWLFN